MHGTKSAALAIAQAMRERNYSTQAWSTHPLHPSIGPDFCEVDMVNFIFTMDLLNYSFWSELPEDRRFCVEYRGKHWTGYNSLVAALRKGLDEGVPITTPRFWRSRACTDELVKRVFRSASEEEMPLLEERIRFLREAAKRLHEVSCQPMRRTETGIVLTVKSFDDPGDDGSHEELVPDTDAIDQANGAQPVAEPANVPTGCVPDTSSEPHEDSVMKDQRELSTSDESTEHSSPAQTSESLRAGGLWQLPLDMSSEREHPTQNGVETVEKSADLGPTAVVSAAVTQPDKTVIRLVEKAEHSAGKLVNLLGKYIPAFLDETRFEGRRVRLMKRAQIFVADLWAALDGSSYGEFDDIHHLTMFAGG